jgi:Uma2 family endonuclease
MSVVGRVLNAGELKRMIRRRRRLGLDHKDEVWDGVYVIMPDPTMVHQEIIGTLYDAFSAVVRLPGLGRVVMGSNVSDRRVRWKKNFRVPDLVVVLTGGRAVDCGTHWMGGPDVVVEVRSPGDDTDFKIPFYGTIGVRELLIVDRDSRAVQLLRHDGRELVPVGARDRQGAKWLMSMVVPLAFRRTAPRGQGPRIQVERTDDAPGQWGY